MTCYWYKGSRFDGEILFGELEGEDEEMVATRLLALGISPITIKALWSGRDPTNTDLMTAFTRKPGHGDLTRFFWQLSYLLNAGVPLVEALESMEKSYTGRGIRRLLRELVDDLYAGYSFAEAMSRHPHIFSRLLINMVRIGESTGRIGEVFHLIFFYLSKQQNLRNRLFNTFKMPVIGLIGIVILVVIVNVGVIPALLDIFSMFHAQLPPTTRFLIATSNFITGYWPQILGGAFFLTTAFLIFVSTPNGRLYWDRTKLKLPFLGGVILQFNMVGFVHSLSIAVNAGVHFHHALHLAAEVVKNAYFAKALTEINHKVQVGETFTDGMREYDIFDSMIQRMMGVGEETGRFREMLKEVADFMDQELDFRVMSFISSLEPAIIILMGLMVMLMAIGIFLPMWDLIFALDKPK